MKNNFFNFENTYTNLPTEFYTKVRPKKVSSPKLLVFNKDLCSELDFDITLFPSEHLADLLCGNQVPEGSSCIAQAMRDINLVILLCLVMEELFY